VEPSVPSVVIVVDNYVAGGVDIVTSQLLDHYSKMDCSLTLVSNSNNPTLHKFKAQDSSGTNYVSFGWVLTRWFTTSEGRHRLPYGQMMRYFLEIALFPWYVIRFAWIFRTYGKSNFLCINGGYPGSSLIRAAAVGSKFPFRRGTCILSIHNMAVKSRKSLAFIDNCLDFLVFSSVDQVLGVSESCLLSLEVRPKSVKTSDKKVIRNSISKSTDFNALMNSTLVIPDSKIKFFMPCTYDPRKGHEVALRALAVMIDAGISASLLCAGDDPSGYKGEVEKLSQLLGISNDVQLLEYHTDISSLYRDSHVVLAPYLGPESFCLTILEALSLGRPVIATKIDAIVEIYETCDSVKLIPAADVSALATAMMDISSHNVAIQSFKESPVTNFLTSFQSEYMFQQYDDVLRVSV
jgi:glycosyltransferase involved in cell wall biosynthesis